MRLFSIRRLSTVLVLILGTVALSGCAWVLGPTRGLPRDFTDQVGEEPLRVVEEELGVTINRGGSPPTFPGFGGEYLASPYVMTETTVPNDFASPGTSFADQYFRFFDQNEATQEISVQLAQGGNIGDGIGGYISGRFNSFTVFVIVDSVRTSDGAETQSLRVFSGRLTDDGIRDYQHALVMLENNGNSGFIANDTGRSFEDGDGLAERSSFPTVNELPSSTLPRSDSAVQ